MSTSDRLAPGVEKDVEERLFRGSTKPDYQGASDSNVSFVEWLLFIHVGL